MKTTHKVLAAAAGALCGAAAAVMLNRSRFRRLVRREARDLFESSDEAEAPSDAALESLPRPVREYAERTFASGRRGVSRVRLRHGGTFRTKLGGRWLEARGVEYFTASPPGFIWWGRVHMAPALWFDARDRSVVGDGSMYVKLASTFTIFDSEGPGIDQGALVRLLGEMVWFPSALFDARYVTWSPLEGRSARAHIRVDEQEAWCDFSFDEKGLPTSVYTERFRDTEEGPVLTPWSVRNEDFRDVDGFPVPHRSVVSWHVNGRATPYADFRIERIEYDVAEPF